MANVIRSLLPPFQPQHTEANILGRVETFRIPSFLHEQDQTNLEVQGSHRVRSDACISGCARCYLLFRNPYFAAV